MDYASPEIRFETEVSSGTYIRALARDIGQALGTGAYLGALQREAIGECELEDACTLEQLKAEPDRYLHNTLKCANLKED